MNEITNEQLYKMHSELSGLRQSVLGFLLKSRIADFYKENGIRIEALITRLKKTQADFMEMDEKGNPVIVEVEGEKQVKMHEGKVIADFNQATMDIMNEKVTIR